MDGLYITCGRRPEIIDFTDAERIMGNRIELVHPFSDENITMAVLLDRDERKESLTLLDEDSYELDEVRGPALFYREDEENLTEDDFDVIETHIRVYETEEEDEPFPEEDEDFDDESFSPTHIVDGITFSEMLKNERAEEEKFFY